MSHIGNKDRGRSGRGAKATDEKEDGQYEEDPTQHSDLPVDTTQRENKGRSTPLPQFASMREANVKGKKAKPVSGGPRAQNTSAQKRSAVSEALIPVVAASNNTAPTCKKAKLETLCDFLGPAGATSTKKVTVQNEDDEEEEHPPESGSEAHPKRNRSTLPPLGVELVTYARREGVSVRRLLLSGRAYELVQQARDNKRNEAAGLESKKPIVEAKETKLRDKKQNRALEEESKKHVVEDKQTIASKTIPKEKTARSASPSSPRTAASRLTTPEDRSSVSPHRFATSPASLASTTGASSSATTPVKLPTAAKPVTVTSDGKVTFQTPEAYAKYVHALRVLEESKKKKAAMKAKKRQEQ